MQSYTSAERWQQEGPYAETTYSSDLYGPLAVRAVREHDPARGPFFLYLPWQAVHSPHTGPPGWPKDDAYRGSLWSTDQYAGELVAVLKERGLWDNTLIVYSSDNGGTAGGNNYPLR